ncbi:MAG: Gfo/Idh/MocA family oxidoreductase [Acidobacteria bacterium]|nr:Gfo/Idh/MocA family oxidoreductase [Acidobacteriota bacterium]
MARSGVVGVGIIGTGFARTTQLPGFAACEGARVVAVTSARRENAERAAREFDIPFVADDWRGVVARADVDLVSIVTPPDTHAEMATAALEAGKAVLCEKPMAKNADETALMCAAARAAGRLALLDHELRFLPARRLMREMILGGELGRVRHAKFLFRADSRALADRPWNWWSDERAGGGALGAIGSHAVDALHWLFGTRVSHVSAALATHVRERPHEPTGGDPRPVTSDDEASLLVNFREGGAAERATGVVSISMAEAGRPEHTVEVFGTDGALRIDGAGRLSRARVGGGEWQSVETEEAPLAGGMRDNEWSRGFTVFAREMVAALREGRATVEGAATFDDGHQIQLVLDAARAAHASGCRVAVGGE